MVSYETLSAEKREVKGKNVKKLQREDKIPAVVYGHGFDNILVEVPGREFTKLYRQVGGSSVIRLIVGGEQFNVLVHDVAVDPVTGVIQHVDFLRIRAGEKITTEVPIHLVGECSMAKALGGVLLKELDKIEIRCLPDNLISHVDVDISGIQGFNEPIFVRDLKLPTTIEVMIDKDVAVVTVAPPKVEEEAPAVTEELIPEELKKEQEEAAAAQAAVSEEGKKEPKKEK